MARDPLLPTEIDANSPLDETLFGKIDDNDVDHESRIQILEALTIAPQEDDLADVFADIRTDPRFFSNEPLLFNKTFHPLTHTSSTSYNSSSQSRNKEDFTGKENDVMRFYGHDVSDDFTHISSSTAYYKQSVLIIEKDGVIQFRLKGPNNFFGIGVGLFSNVRSDNVEVLIDGQTPTSLGLTDIDGTAAFDTFSTNSADLRYQGIFWYYGLDSEDHVITITNIDSAAKDFYLNFMRVGYKTRDFTLTNKLKINKSQALIKGIVNNLAETELTFDRSTGYGHTDSVVGNASGVLRVSKGLEAAQTQIKAGETISFSSAVTSLNVKSSHFFPTKGICLFQHPQGDIFQFSYNGKTEATPANNSLDNIKWQIQPDRDLEIEQGFENVNTNGAARYNANIVYWGEAPIEITSANNKLDYEITITDGTGTPVTTSHTATIPDGIYGTDIIHIQHTIIDQMESIKPLIPSGGRYYIKYDKKIRRYQIGADGPQVTKIEFNFGTGPNIASSIHTTLGFAATDLIDDKLYVSTIDRDHRTIKALEFDKSLRSFDNNVKSSASVNSITTEANDVRQRLVMPVRGMNSAGQVTVDCYPEKDAIGIVVYIVDRGQQIEYGLNAQIDNFGQIWFRDGRASDLSADPLRGEAKPYILLFPRGSKRIRLATKRYGAHSHAGLFSSTTVNFAGYKNVYSRPNIEDVGSDEQILKSFDIAPKSYYSNNYSFKDGLLYSPGAGDNVNTVSEVGSWSPALNQTSWGGDIRTTATTGDYIEVNFTLTGDGGGIHFKTHGITTASVSHFYISTGAIVEATDLVSLAQDRCISSDQTFNNAGIFGLKAGTYTARLKNISTLAATLRVAGFVITDTVPADVNKYTPEDMANDGQGVAYPMNYIAHIPLHHYGDRTYERVRNSAYKEGKTTNFYYSNGDLQVTLNQDFGTAAFLQDQHYNASMAIFQTDYVAAYDFCKSLAIDCANLDSTSITNTVFIDEVQAPNTTTLAKSTKNADAHPNQYYRNEHVFKKFDLVATMIVKTVALTDTRGIIVGRPVVLVDNVGDEEQGIIASVVVGVSFDVVTPLATLLPANIVEARFYGFHQTRFRNETTTQARIGVFKFEPLDITPSGFKKRNTVGTVLETVAENQIVASGDLLIMPMFSDGTQPSFHEANIDLMGYGAGTFQMDSSDFPLVTGSDGAEVKITATKLVPESTDGMEWEY